MMGGDEVVLQPGEHSHIFVLFSSCTFVHGICIIGRERRSNAATCIGPTAHL
jgi:hypothetical protein